MTKKDIVELTGLHRSDVNKAFVAASKVMTSIKAKTAKCRRKGSVGQANFNMEEILLACSYLRRGKGLTELELALLKEMYVPPKSDVALTHPWQGYIKGTGEFVNTLNDRTRCCAVCEFCMARKMRGAYKPFCNLYGMNLTRGGKSPYKTRCLSFSRSNTILLFRNSGPPAIKGERPKKVRLAGFLDLA